MSQTCPSCHSPLPPNAPAGLCPRCLLERGMQDATQGFSPATTPWSPPTPAELAPLFPELTILEILGRGGMGAVYKALQKNLDRTVALKILPPSIGAQSVGGGGFAERFTREARALAKLNHPNIVTLYEFGTRQQPLGEERPGGSAGEGAGAPPAPPLTTPLYYFLMEFVDGITLRQLMASSRLEPREALAIVPQVCDALQYAHDLGIVHRDIKPENILLDRRGRVKVADFGLAKLAQDSAAPTSPPEGELHGTLDLTEAGKTVGTPKYMAPEQFAHPEAVDHRADIYALGVVFYQMLTGQLPSAPIQPPSSKIVLDIRLDQVVLRALESRPDLRFQNAADLKTSVENLTATPAAATHNPASAAPLPPPPVPSPYPSPIPRTPDARQQALDALRIPSLALRIIPFFNLALLAVMLLVFIFLRSATAPLANISGGPSTRWTAWVIILPFLLVGLFIPLNLFVALAAARMAKLRNYSLSITACIIALFLGAGNFLLLPFAIWALILLARPEIKSAFDTPANPAHPRQRSIILPILVAACLLFLFIPVVVLALWILSSPHFVVSRSSAPPVTRYLAPASVQLPALPGFSPPTERLLSPRDADNSGSLFLDLESGATYKPTFPLNFSAPDPGPGLTEASMQHLVKSSLMIQVFGPNGIMAEGPPRSDVDLLIHFADDHFDTLNLDLQEIPAGPPEHFNTTTADQVRSLFRELDAGRIPRGEIPAFTFNSLYNTGLGPTKAFRTRSLSMGLYQIDGTANPSGRTLRIRYKLLNDPVSPLPQIATVEAPAVTAPPRAPSPTTLPATQPAPQYGPVSDGLQVAVLLSPAKTSFTLGDTIGLTYQIRNASDHNITLAGDSWRQDPGDLSLEDAQGKSIQLFSIWYSGWAILQRNVLAPGDTVLVRSSALALLPENSEKSPNHPVGHYAKVPPGRYTLRFKLHFPDLVQQPDTAANDWKGDLEPPPISLDLHSPQN